MKLKSIKGSVTVEASLALPIFIGAVLSIAFLIKLVYVQEVVQHAINGAADEMAATGYVYYISGIKGINDTVNSGLESGENAVKSQASSVSNLLGDIGKLTGDSNNSSNEAGGFEMIKTIKNDFTNAINSKNGILENPLTFLKNVACMISAGAFDDFKTELCIPITRLYLKKYFTQNENIDFNKRLKFLNIAGGIDGFNLNNSHFFEDSNDNIDIRVRYKLELPIPFRIIPSIEMEQRAVQRAWTSGDVGSAATDKNQSGGVWSLGNLERGRIIRQTFGANLPFEFPVIANFDSGTATMIKSMDTTAAYYQNSENLKEKIMGYTKELKNFKGGRHGDAEVNGSSINQRVLKLIIPENDLTSSNQAALDECARLSETYGIRIEIIRYQQKKVDNADDKE